MHCCLSHQLSTQLAFFCFFLCITCIMQGMAECSGNLVSDNLMASPVAETALKTTALKVIMVCVSTCLDEFAQPQAILMFICPCLSAYFQVRSVSTCQCMPGGGGLQHATPPRQYLRQQAVGGCQRTCRAGSNGVRQPHHLHLLLQPAALH